MSSKIKNNLYEIAAALMMSALCISGLVIMDVIQHDNFITYLMWVLFGVSTVMFIFYEIQYFLLKRKNSANEKGADA